MNRPCVCAVALLLLAAAATQPQQKPPATKPTPAAPKQQTPVAWYERILGIDPKAYSNLTAVRGADAFDAAPRLVSFDRATGVETTLWKCGECWAPAVVSEGIAVLRGTGGGAPELWLVPTSGEPRRIAKIEGATAIVGAAADRLFVGVTAHQCERSSEGPYALLAVDRSGQIAALPDSPCFGSLNLTAAGRVRGDRLLGTTRKVDLAGKRRPRRIVVYAPATAAAPEGELFDERLSAAVDRFDPVWLSDDRIVYVAGD